jgi:hypothetical protein
MSEETRTKICNRCGKERSWDDFQKRTENKRPVAYCKDCRDQYRKDWVAKNHEHILEWSAEWREKHVEKLYRMKRNSHLKRKYGITLEQYDDLVKKQGGKCAICRERVPEVVDHDHETKEIRGLLCHPCNKGLGMFRENSLTLMNAEIGRAHV